VKLKNSGLQPSYSCELWIYLNAEMLPPGVYPIVYDRLHLLLGIIAPNAEIQQRVLIGAAHVGHELEGALIEALTFKLCFTDAVGRSWVRDKSGRLKKYDRRIRTLIYERGAKQEKNVQLDASHWADADS
jgi:hypothetical protein